MKDDAISRRAAIDDMCKHFNYDVHDDLVYWNREHVLRVLKDLPSAKSEPSTEIQEILEYLDTTLHPIVSPDNWNVYSELHDMVSRLPSAEQKRERIKWIPHESVFGGLDEKVYTCDKCGYNIGFHVENFCPNCGGKYER